MIISSYILPKCVAEKFKHEIFSVKKVGEDYLCKVTTDVAFIDGYKLVLPFNTYGVNFEAEVKGDEIRLVPVAKSKPTEWENKLAEVEEMIEKMKKAHPDSAAYTDVLSATVERIKKC